MGVVESGRIAIDPQEFLLGVLGDKARCPNAVKIDSPGMQEGFNGPCSFVEVENLEGIVDGFPIVQGNIADQGFHIVTHADIGVFILS